MRRNVFVLLFLAGLFLASCATFNADRSTVRKDSVPLPQLKGAIELGAIDSKSSDISSAEFHRAVYQSFRGQKIFAQPGNGKYILDITYSKSEPFQSQAEGAEVIVFIEYMLFNPQNHGFLVGNDVRSSCYIRTVSSNDFQILDNVWTAIGISDKIPTLLTSVKPIERDKSSVIEDSPEKDEALGYPTDGTYVSSNNQDEIITLASECALRRGLVQVMRELHQYRLSNS